MNICMQEPGKIQSGSCIQLYRFLDLLDISFKGRLSRQ